MNASGIEDTGSVSGDQGRPVVRLDEIGSLIRQKRRTERLTLEEASQQIGVSPATLSRLERRTFASAPGQQVPTPDMRTLAAIADWLEIVVAGSGFTPVASPIGRGDPVVTSVPNAVEAHLRADRNLDPTNAALLARIFRAAYSEFADTTRDGSIQPEHKAAIGESDVEDE